jgi:hypothetical protein
VNAVDPPPIGIVAPLLGYGARSGTFSSVVTPTYSDRAFQSWYDNPYANNFGLQVVPSGSGPAAATLARPHTVGHTSRPPHLPPGRHH